MTGGTAWKIILCLPRTIMRNDAISKYLSYILRHKPESIGLKLDTKGWASIDEIIQKTQQFKLTSDLIKKIVDTSPKKRFAIKNDLIRANQGHSISIDLGISKRTPPAVLYHGTATRFISSIMKEGIVSKERQHVHLSENVNIATDVGKRHGKPIVLKIDTLKMHHDGKIFYLSDNGVWLTGDVPVNYIEILREHG